MNNKNFFKMGNLRSLAVDFVNECLLAVAVVAVFAVFLKKAYIGGFGDGEILSDVILKSIQMHITVIRIFQQNRQ